MECFEKYRSGISLSQLVAWRTGTAGKGIVVPGLSAASTFLLPLTLAVIFPYVYLLKMGKIQCGTPCLEGCQPSPQRSNRCREQLVFQAHAAVLLKDILI